MNHSKHEAMAHAPAAVATGAHGGIDAAGMSNVGRSRPRDEDPFVIATLEHAMIVHDSSPRAAAGSRGGLSGTLLMVGAGLAGEGGGDISGRAAVSTVARCLLDAMPWTAVSGTLDEPSWGKIGEPRASAT